MMLLSPRPPAVLAILVSTIVSIVGSGFGLIFVDGLKSPSSIIKKTTDPPLLDVPVYSLATLNDDGTTNMNIVTYATPVATPPKRVWSLGLFKGTTSDENVIRTGKCILQLLTKDHTDVVPILGGTKGRDFDKQTACERLGLKWQPLLPVNDEEDGDGEDQIQVLPGCASYIQLDIQGGVVDAGSHHIAAFCEVTGMYVCDTDDESSGSSGDDEDVATHLSTGYLRSLGIITPQGRVAESAIPVVGEFQ
eukprot:CAMPEP_0113491144 /NCGR_PEP_ID=MMETSP0014_2-20120614/27406_1 /TAXON_ID=2857 /ORGANISM="Nitzschia sp." /LENGTH=248 /DNA_ID=CAMNT_0000384929 /DNA_START=179 /DNA_END=925 /DNA_ORIENTATION=- /assembly_acc=CAM_ASM_000159